MPKQQSAWSLTNTKDLLFTAGEKWSQDSVPRLAAAFSFYAILSLSPLLVLAITVSGFFVQGAERHLLSEAAGFVGPQGRDLLSGMIAKVNDRQTGLIATFSSLVVTFFSASNLFLQLDDAIRAIWGIKERGPFIHTVVSTRILAFLGVLTFGVVFIGWLFLDSWLDRLSRETLGSAAWPFVSLAVALILLTVVFGFSFKALAKRPLSWRDVLPGAVVTSLGFAAGKSLLAEYFALAGVSAVYGTAGALVVILLWLYYMAQIYFFGVEVTYVYTHTHGVNAPAAVDG